MKKAVVIRQMLYLVIAWFLVSCNDRDDNLDLESGGGDDATQNDNRFVDENGTEYATGATCMANGEYAVDSSNLLTGLQIPETLPGSFDFSALLPPIGNQGMQGSCVSWAVSYYMKGIQERVTGQAATTTAFSPAYTYNQLTQGNCSGTTIEATLDILQEKGVPPLVDFPYSDTECATLPDENIDAIAAMARIGDYKALSGENMVNEMKTLLTQETPIIISAFLSPEFGKTDGLGLTAYREHAVDYSSANACHAMLVVGYSDENNAFKTVNSWGSTWGDNGFVWIDYAAFENVLTEEDFKVITSALVAFDL